MNHLSSFGPLIRSSQCDEREIKFVYVARHYIRLKTRTDRSVHIAFLHVAVRLKGKPQVKTANKQFKALSRKIKGEGKINEGHGLSG